MYRLLALYILLLSLGTKFNLPLFGKEIQLADLFFIFILVKVISKMRIGSERILFKPPAVIRYLVLTLLLLLLLSCLFSLKITRSLIEFMAIVYLVTLYLWVSNIPLDRQRFKSLLYLWLYLSGGLCILALGGFVLSTMFDKNTWLVQNYPSMKSLIPFGRVTATFPTMNMFASFLHVSVVFLLVFIVYERWRPRYILLAVFMLICVLLSASRNLLGIFITIFLALLPIRSRPYSSMSKYISFSLSLALLFLVTVTTIWCIFPAKINYDRKAHTFSLSVNTAPSLYAILNRMSIRMIKEKFLLGVGPGMFNQTMIEQLDWGEAKDTYEAKGISDRNASVDPHNTYLGWAAEAGLPFVIVMIGLFYSIARFIWKGYRASGSDYFLGGFCYICLCGMAGFILNGLYIDILTMRHFWVMLGLGTLVAGHYRKD